MLRKSEHLFSKSGFAWFFWGYSSAGRAPALQAGGQRFDPAYLHQTVYPLVDGWFALLGDFDR